MAICDICMAELDPGCYSEMLIKTRSGSLAPTVTRSLGYLCESCTERFDEGLAGGTAPEVKPEVKQVTPTQRPCGCGCGELASPGKRFIRGHHTRLKRGAACRQ